MKNRVSIIITVHNYGRFVATAIDSALQQTYPEIEVIVVDDGSVDNTAEILKSYSEDPRIEILTLDGVGLAAACNVGIEKSTGDYIVRLDADDWFDENLVLTLARELDIQKDIALVYSDYFSVNLHGQVIATHRRSKIDVEVELLDRPALGAGAMFRRKVWEDIGGYNEELSHQEDYDFWIRVIEHYPVNNVSLPLMYYRRHNDSMSKNLTTRLKARQTVKNEFIQKYREVPDNILMVIPARGDLIENRKLPLLPLGGEVLLNKTIKAAKSSKYVSRIITSTEDSEIAEVAKALGSEVPYVRRLSSDIEAMTVPFSQVLSELLRWLEDREEYRPSLVVVMNPHTPFLTALQADEAIATQVIFDTDSVITVEEDKTYHWRPGRFGLEPVGPRERKLRIEKEMIFREVSGLYVISPEVTMNPKLVQKSSDDMFGQSIGHIEVENESTLKIENRYNYWLALQRVAQNDK